MQQRCSCAPIERLIHPNPPPRPSTHPTKQVVDHPAFSWTFVLLIVANTAILAMTTAGAVGGVCVGWGEG